EKLVERGQSVDRGSGREEVEQVFAGAEGLALPFGLKIVMDRAALDHDSLEPLALHDPELGRPVAAPTHPLNHHAPGVDLRPQRTPGAPTPLGSLPGRVAT